VVILSAALTGFVVRPLLQKALVHEFPQPHGGDLLAELRPTLPEADFEELTVRLGAGCPSS